MVTTGFLLPKQDKSQLKPCRSVPVMQPMIKQYIQPEEAVSSQKLPADLKVAEFCWCLKKKNHTPEKTQWV